MTPREWTHLVGLSVLWGIPYLLTEIALLELSPPAIAFSRIALGAALLVPLALKRGGIRTVVSRPWQLVSIALLDAAAPFMLIAAAQETITSSLAGILVSTVPLFVALVAPWLDPGERMGPVRLAGFVAGFLGVALLLGIDIRGGTEQLLGALMALGASASYATAALLIRRWFRNTDPVVLTAAVLAAGAVLFLPLMSARAPTSIPSTSVVVAVLALGTASTAAAFLLFYRLVVSVGAGRASLVTYIAPAVAVLAGVVLLREPFTLTTAVGLALILAGSAVAGGRLKSA